MPSDSLVLGCHLGVDIKTPELPPNAALGAGPLPSQYIVPGYRGYFDENFQEIGPKIEPDINDQQVDDCVGQGCHVLLTAQEGAVSSARDNWRLAKRLDGYPLEGFGTTIWAGLDAYVLSGVAEERLVPSNKPMTRTQYLGLGDVTEEIKENRAKHKGKQPYYVARNRAMETIYLTKMPMVTSTMWYAQDNQIGADGLMRMPTSNSGMGHCVACIGWVLRMVDGALETVLVMVNSFGPKWGRFGLFYVPVRTTLPRFGNFYTVLDEDTDPIALRAKYEGKNVIVAGRPEHWKIEGGFRRQYPNEIVWWSHGNQFGVDTFQVVPDELEAFELGPDMTLGPWAELIRQIRGHYGIK